MQRIGTIIRKDSIHSFLRFKLSWSETLSLPEYNEGRVELLTRFESVACTQASLSIGSDRAPTAQAPALGSMIWLSAALLYSLVLSMLVSGGDPRRLQPLALSQDHSTTPQQHGQ